MALKKQNQLIAFQTMLVSWESIQQFAREQRYSSFLKMFRFKKNNSNVRSECTTVDVNLNEMGVFEYWRALQASLHQLIVVYNSSPKNVEY